jgi:hypothetical protein
MQSCKECHGNGYRILYTQTILGKPGKYGEQPVLLKPYLRFCECEEGAEVEELHMQGEIWIDAGTRQVTRRKEDYDKEN